MKLALGNDHAGYKLRKVAIQAANDLGYEIVDFGTTDELAVYTTPIAEKVANYVAENQGKGLLICGSGVGMSIAANKVPGVRCVCCSDLFTCESSRLHNNTNILALGSRVVNLATAENLIRRWLQAEYEGGRREIAYELITELEEKYLQVKARE